MSMEPEIAEVTEQEERAANGDAGRTLDRKELAALIRQVMDERDFENSLSPEERLRRAAYAAEGPDQMVTVPARYVHEALTAAYSRSDQFMLADAAEATTPYTPSRSMRERAASFRRRAEMLEKVATLMEAGVIPADVAETLMYEGER